METTKDKTAILFRLGGLGDILIITPVARELKKRGYVVDGCFGSPTCNIQKIIGNTGLFRKVYEYGKMFHGLDVYVNEDGDHNSIELLKDSYDLTVDYKNSIELNSHHKERATGRGNEWFQSQSSNYVNWCDMMFSWAGIDPTTIADEDKVPAYIVETNEMEWARKIVGSEFVITIQTNASSLVRTWYHPDRLPDAIRKAFPGKRFTFLIFDGARWQLLKGNNVFPVAIPSTIDPMRASCALVSESDIFIGADSGLSHVAEAVQTQSIVFYTTVPAWTRTKYYKYSHPVEPIGEVFDGVRCRPCFVLDRYCPRIRERALSQLTPREIRIKDAAEKGESPQLVAKEFNTTEQGILMESEILQRRYNALIEEQAPCTTTITPERIVDEVKKIIEGIK